MVKIKMVYEGDLRCRLTHGPSGDVITTDAPTDNMGKGEAFSPTDLLAASLGACILTTMAIAARKNNFEMGRAFLDLEKEMIAAPVRKVGRVSVVLKMPPGLKPDQRKILEQAGLNCPVHKSLSADVQTPVRIEYPD